MLNRFVWTDLSTFDMGQARSTYAALFGWEFAGDASYDFAGLGEEAVAAVFPMPERLVEINMPSFWMSYVRVADVAAIVAQARTHAGVVIEVEPQAFDAEARIALIRDPSGAGFTVYEGPDITPKLAPGTAGSVVARAHHLPDVEMIAPFYADLFGWRFRKAAQTTWPVYDILHADGTVLAQAEEVPEAIRGKFRYWMPCFGVTSVEDAVTVLERQGGQRVHDLGDGRVMVADPQGAHFMMRGTASDRARHGDLAKSGAVVPSTERAPEARSPTLPWKAVLGILCMWLAVALDIQAFWGVLFLIWTWPAIRSGEAHFVETVSRRRNPGVYWALVGTWILLCLWLIYETAAPFL